MVLIEMKQEIQTHTLGCKVNFADTQQLAENVSCADEKNMEIIGTCCVTAEGERQSRKEVRRASRRVGSGGKVFVTGCAATLDPSAFKNIAGNVEVVTGKPEEAARLISSLAVAECGARESSASPSRASQRTRYFLKVQDGCGRRCSYCIIPSVRGRPVSLPVEDILRIAAGKVRNGCREIVVTGINVGAYNDRGRGISGLLERLSHLDGLKRLRLSSIEAAYFDKRLLQVIAENRIIGRHLHIPLQSGDDSVLKSMRRSYDLGMFLQKIQMVKDTMPEINLTTDVIVGFPTEDAKRFE
ncbi:MAG: radical SAM protein, partial [Actinomycetota bacterium]